MRPAQFDVGRVGDAHPDSPWGDGGGIGGVQGDQGLGGVLGARRPG
ncbi:hypothetical protein ACF08N_29610 [Streptomyces sp. NPDC015127]